MNKFIAFLGVIVIVSLTGCATTPGVDKVITNTKIEYIYPPDDLIKNFVVPEPPSKESYVVLSCDEREVVLTKYIYDLMTVIKKYKLEVNNLKDWNTKMKALETPNEK